MKKLHALQIQTNTYFHPIEKLEFYQSKVKNCPYVFDIQHLLENIKKIKQKQILCHNDWVSGNILFGKNKNYLIDYEYASDNDPLFDVMSFLTENQIDDDQQRQLFYSAYFDKQPDLETMYALTLWEEFHNCLWCYWTFMMFEEKNENIYKEIAEMKYDAWKRVYKKVKN